MVGSADAPEFDRAIELGTVSARSANLARDLATRPGNVATPSYLAEVARQIATAHGMKLTVLDREQMRAEGMKALLAVAQGTQEEPRFIALEYNGGAKGARPLVLIGKGVTFDSGGISIKPADRMEDMKFDMCGAAAVLGALRGIAELKLKANVVGLIPSTENLPSGTAVKPGDVIGSHLGKTIEIINTDAEGRLILVDALSYARRYNPAAMIDAATLTGAVVVALGQQAIGLMGNDGDLIDDIMAAGLRAGERCWNLPLWDEYRELLDSTIADIKNSGGRQAGTITGGWFLKDFVVDIPWAHLDIAGTAYRDDAVPYLRKGATGAPTRLFIEWVRSRSE
jgi:leucyl aminopeptidase